MGTTKTALQAGSLSRKWVAAIEGYSHLLSDGSESAVQTAWAGTDWASKTIIPGLSVDLQVDQRLDPWQPFHGGGRLSLVVKDSVDDTFGIETHRKTAGDETFLAASLDSNDTTVTVLATSSFASSGEVHIGTECIAYSGKTATTFTGLTRGKYSPFGVDGGTRFGHPHRVRTDPNGVTLKPLVTEQPRVWLGRLVGLWMHRNVAGTLDVKAQAQLVFAGRIVEVRDDPETQSTIVEVEHVLDSIGDWTLGREMYSAKLTGGIRLGIDVEFEFGDSDDTGNTAFNNATPLTVVTSGASAPYEINEGVYSATEIHGFLNDWLEAALTAGDIVGTYSFSVVRVGTEDARTRIAWHIDEPGAVTTASWTLIMPRRVAIFLGFQSQGIELPGHRRLIGAQDYSSDNETYFYYSADLPYQSLISQQPNGAIVGTLDLEDEAGVFVDQYDSLPAPGVIKPQTDLGLEWGMFLVDGKRIIRAAKDGTTLKHIALPVNWAPLSNFGGTEEFELTRTFAEPSYFEIRQIFVFDANLATFIKQLFYSTGTASYNETTYDVLPFGVGLAVPGVLLGDTFEATVDALPGSTLPQVTIVDKPRALSEMLTGDLIARWAFPRWKDQGIQFASWPTPVTSASVATLSEGTKAAPAGNEENHRTASVFTNDWQRSVIKWEYNRDFADLGEEKYRSDVIFEDPTAIDDAGGVGDPTTIKFPNLFGDESQVGVGIGQLSRLFLGNLTLFSRGTRISTRSIDARYWEGYSVGDVVLVQDEFARDPDTGIRGTSRPGVLVAHRWKPGGGDCVGPGQMSGEVEVMFLELNRIAPYVPTAQVDDTATDAGYDAGTKTLTCYAHKHSESSEAADATHFPAGAKVRVIEIDPSNPASPTSWDDTVASQTGNTITLTTGLAGWDTGLRYRVISDDYGDASATQQTGFAYQADDADGLIANSRVPFQYGFGLQDTTSPTANSASDQLELPPNASYGDGVGRDVGHEAGLQRLLTAAHDYRSAYSLPKLDNTVLSGSGVSGTWKLVEVRPVFLGFDTYTTSVTCNVSVSVWYRSSDGTNASVRVTLVRQLPDDASVNDVDRGQFYSEQTFGPTTSTTWAAATAANLSATAKNLSGRAWLIVECSEKAETRGIVKCQVSARSYA